MLRKASSRENRKDLRDLSEKIAADAHALLHDEKGVGIELTHGLLQLRDLEFRDADAQYAHVALRICALALPVRHAAAKARHDAARELGVCVPCEDEHLHIDVLLVPAVDEERAEHGVNDGVDGRLDVEEQCAGDVEHDVEAQRKTSDGEAAAALCEAQADDIEPSGRAAAGQSQAKGKAAQDAADEARGERIVQDRHGGRLDHAQKERRRAHADQRADQKRAPEVAPREIQHRNIDEKVQNTGDVHPCGQLNGLREQCSDDLAQSDYAAGVEAHRYNEKVHAQRVEECCENRDQDARPFVLQRFVQHSSCPHFSPH